MWYLVIIIVTFFGGAAVSAISEIKKKDLSFLVYMCGFIGGITLILLCNNDTPTSMDVYQGKTTLEITYKDGVDIDTVVIFKDKKK